MNVWERRTVSGKPLVGVHVIDDDEVIKLVQALHLIYEVMGSKEDVLAFFGDFLDENEMSMIRVKLRELYQ